MAEIEGLTVRIGADTSGFDSGVKSTTASLGKLTSLAAPAAKAIAAIGVAAAAATAAVAALTMAGMRELDTQIKLARQLDGTQGALRGLQLAAGDAGISAGEMNSALQRMSAALGEARTGTGNAADALKRLGLSASELSRMDIDERMATIADRMRDMGLSGDQAARMLRELGIRNTALINLMRQGGDAIRGATQEIKDYGLAIDSVDAATIEAANDAMSRIGLVVESVRNALAVNFAPILLELADRFNTAAREAGGWGQMVVAMAEASARGIAKLLDIVHNFKAGLQTINLVVALMRKWFADFTVSAARGFAEMIDYITDKINGLINLANQLPFIEIDLIGSAQDSTLVKSLEASADAALQGLRDAHDEAKRFIEAGSSLDAVDKFFKDVEARRQAFMDSISESDGTSIVPGMSEDGDGKDRQKLIESLQSRLELLRESFMAEGELERKRYLERAEDIRQAHELELIDAQEHALMMEQLAAQHQANLADIEKRATDERLKLQKQEAQARQAVVGGMMNNLVSLMNSGSRAMFNIGKIAAIAQALLSGREAIVSSYAAGAKIGGPVLGAAFAATAAAATAAQIASVRSTTFGGGASTGGSTGGGGTSAIAQGPVQAQPQQTSAAQGGTIVIEGISPDSLYSGRAVNGLIEALRDAQRNGAQLVIA